MAHKTGRQDVAHEMMSVVDHGAGGMGRAHHGPIMRRVQDLLKAVAPVNTDTRGI
jgi:hypothetical protein